MVVLYLYHQVVAVFGKDPRTYGITVTEFKGEENQLKSVVTEEVKISSAGIERIPGTQKEWPADLVILSMGFVSPEQSIHSQLGLELDQRNNIHAEYGDFRTNLEGVFAAGDCRRGQSLVVWAINEGRGVAEKCDQYLKQRISSEEDEIFIQCKCKQFRRYYSINH